MPLIVACAGCRHQLRLADDAVGRKVRCPRCKAVFTATPPPIEIDYEPPIEIDYEPPPTTRRLGDEDVRTPRGGARRADDDDERVSRQRPQTDEDDDRADVARELEVWADGRVRKYVLFALLPGATVMALLAVVFLVKPLSRPGLESLWAVLALLSALQFATVVGVLFKADWPFGTLITVAPVVVSNMLLKLVRTVNPNAGQGGFVSQLPFLLAAVVTIGVVWVLLQRRPNWRATEKALDYLETRKSLLDYVLDGKAWDYAENVLKLGTFLRDSAAALTLVTQRFLREPHRRTQILLGLGAGSLAYIVFLVLAVSLIGTRASRGETSGVDSAREWRRPQTHPQADRTNPESPGRARLNTALVAT